MADSSKFSEMLKLGMESFKSDGRMDLAELDRVLALGLEDGVLDKNERDALLNIITSMSAVDFTPDVWARVEELISQYSLDDPN